MIIFIPKYFVSFSLSSQKMTPGHGWTLPSPFLPSCTATRSQKNTWSCQTRLPKAIYLPQEEPRRIQPRRRRSAAKPWRWGSRNPTAMVYRSASPLPTRPTQARTKKASRCPLAGTARRRTRRGRPRAALSGHWRNPTRARRWRSRGGARRGARGRARPGPRSAGAPPGWPCGAASAGRRSSAAPCSTRPAKPCASAEPALPRLRALPLHLFWFFFFLK